MRYLAFHDPRNGRLLVSKILTMLPIIGKISEAGFINSMVPKGVSYSVVETLPDDEYREAWELIDGRVTVNENLAVGIAKQRAFDRWAFVWKRHQDGNLMHRLSRDEERNFCKLRPKIARMKTRSEFEEALKSLRNIK